MTEFEIGDRVRYINTYETFPELYDRRATVTDVSRALNQVDVAWDESTTASDGRKHSAECFEKIEEDLIKIGDTVVIKLSELLVNSGLDRLRAEQTPGTVTGFLRNDRVEVQFSGEHYTRSLYTSRLQKVELATTETTRESVLREASQLIHGDRNLHYGEPTDNFDTIATIWTALLSHKLKDGEVFSAADVADFSIGIKLARNKAGRKRDNYTDIAGYAACGEECREAEEK